MVKEDPRSPMNLAMDQGVRLSKDDREALTRALDLIDDLADIDAKSIPETGPVHLVFKDGRKEEVGKGPIMHMGYLMQRIAAPFYTRAYLEQFNNQPFTLERARDFFPPLEHGGRQIQIALDALEKEETLPASLTGSDWYRLLKDVESQLLETWRRHYQDEATLGIIAKYIVTAKTKPIRKPMGWEYDPIENETIRQEVDKAIDGDTGRETRRRIIDLTHEHWKGWLNSLDENSFEHVEENGMLRLSARFVEHIKQIDPKAAAKLRKVAQADWKGRTGFIWQPWAKLEGAAWNTVPRALSILAEIMVTFQKEQRSLRVQAVTMPSGEDWVLTPRVTGAVSWAMMGKGIPIDDNEYGEANGIVRYASKSFGFIKSSNRPAQQVIPVQRPDLMLTTAVADAQYVISQQACKPLILMLITGQRRNQWASIEEVTKLLNPSVKRIKKHHYQKTAEALRELQGLEIVISVDGSQLAYPVFIIGKPPNPSIAEKTDLVSWRMNKEFADVVAENQSTKNLKGKFLMNLTGVMSMSVQEVPMIRQYICAAGLWNDAKKFGSRDQFDANNITWFSEKEWALQTNSLSDSAYESIRGDRSKRYQMSKDKALTIERLERLKEEKGLLDIEIKGKGRNRKIRPVPTAEYLEASRKWSTRWGK
jgi:hypothetical protein